MGFFTFGMMNNNVTACTAVIVCGTLQRESKVWRSYQHCPQAPSQAVDGKGPALPPFSCFSSTSITFSIVYSAYLKALRCQNSTPAMMAVDGSPISVGNPPVFHKIPNVVLQLHINQGVAGECNLYMCHSLLEVCV